MPIKIQRKEGTNITWESNIVFSMAFSPTETIFEIPRLEYMLYLYKSFNIIEATDEHGDELDLTDICNCCRESVKLELLRKYLEIKDEEVNEEKEIEIGD
jgi:hypothetical protein